MPGQSVAVGKDGFLGLCHDCRVVGTRAGLNRDLADLWVEEHDHNNHGGPEPFARTPDYAGGTIIVANADRIIARYWLKGGVRRGDDQWEFDADAGLPAERLVLKLELARKKAKR